MHRKIRKQKYLILCALVLLISLGYAFLSANLTIAGVTHIGNSERNVYFNHAIVTQFTLNGTSTATNQAIPTITGYGNQEIDYEFTLNQLGDTYEFNVDIVNDGNIDAEINELVTKIKLNGANEEKLTNVNMPEYLEYAVTYVDDSAISAGHRLNAGSTEKIKVHIKFKSDVTNDVYEEVQGQTIEFKLLLDYNQLSVATSTATYYTVTFDADGGIIPNGDAWNGSGTNASKKINTSTYGELPIATKDGYTFLGWKSENNDYIKPTSKLIIKKDHTLYARWFDEKQILLYNVALSKKSKTTYEKNTTKLYDLSENKNNANLYNINLNTSETAITFNGSSSYADLNLESELEFPLTIEMDIATITNSSNSVIFIDGNSRVAFGIYGNYFICVGGSVSYPMYEIPSNFFDGNIKHIVVIYESLSNYKVYINGEACTKSSNNNNWSNSGNKFYLGRRASGTYFNGLLYNFKIYNRIFNENEYLSTNNKSNLIVEYNIEDDNSFDKIEVKSEILEDLVNDNDSKCYNVDLNDSQNGLVFNGSSSYVELGLKSQLVFPLSIEMTVLPQNTSVIYADPISKTAFGYYSGSFITITNSSTKANLFDAPDNFFDNTPKHIIIEYTDLFNTKVYVNGEECNKSSNKNVWDWNSESLKAYIGRRESGTYFKGTLYNFSIYNSLLPEEIILKKYENLNI